jgi:hypothetical protein
MGCDAVDSGRQNQWFGRMCWPRLQYINTISEATDKFCLWMSEELTIQRLGLQLHSCKRERVVTQVEGADPHRCTALNRRHYPVSLVYRTAAAANQPEILQYFTAQSYQYVRWSRLLKRRASRPTAGHFLDAITIQISSFLFNYTRIYQFVQLQCCSVAVLFSCTAVPSLDGFSLQAVTLTTQVTIAARRGSHSGAVQICLLGCDAVSFVE